MAWFSAAEGCEARPRSLSRRRLEGARVDGRARAVAKLGFFELFWIFVVCSVLGLVLETLFHLLVLGVSQDRAGLLFGPFSPIYGFGAVLMTVALNRFRSVSPLAPFVASAVIGGAFEFFVSWIMEALFGIHAWDYSGTFLSFDGRTNFVFMVMWGILGSVWVKLLLPLVLGALGSVSPRWRTGLTAVCLAFMLLDGVMTVQALDCWYGRLAGDAVDTPLEQFYAQHFDDDRMQARFQSMSMNAQDAVRSRR